ncbi:hypothetical protein [Kribbella sp. NPDC050470]|uniref:hypothetical protein n=1 Tax=unclassified Kribbella TaxID=2644121 RepID=UPI0037940172
MTAALFTLHRYEDKSGVSGTGSVAEGVEFSDGSVALRWPGEHPSTAVWPDIRDVEAIHGHGGLTVVEYADQRRLVRAYQQVVFWLVREMTPERLPLSVAPHPDWPDRLLVRLRPTSIAFWVALLDGSMHAATYEQVKGEIVTTWVHPSGDLWLECREPGTYEDLLANERYPLETFDREDR